jgi:hypothetical protein
MALGHCVKRSWAEPQAAPPRHPHDTAPKGVGTHPGDGRLSVGNVSLFDLALPYITCSVASAGTRPGTPSDRSSAMIRARPDAGCFGLLVEPSAPPGPRLVLHLLQVWYHPGNARLGSLRAARPDKNLRQVLKNMDPLGEKSTIYPPRLHFVILLHLVTRVPIEYATCVDARKQRRVARSQTASLHPRSHILRAVDVNGPAAAGGGGSMQGLGRRSGSRAVLY